MDQYHKFFEDVKAGRIVSAYALDGNGLAAAVSKMAFGNHKGVKIDAQVAKEDLFAADFGSIVAEVPADKVAELTIAGVVIGEVEDDAVLSYGDDKSYNGRCSDCMERYAGRRYLKPYPEQRKTTDRHRRA